MRMIYVRWRCRSTFISRVTFASCVHKQLLLQSLFTQSSMCQSTISKNASRSDTTSFSICSEGSHRPFERSNTFDCLRTQPMGTPNLLRKSQSVLDLKGTKLSIIPLSASPLAFLWRRPAPKQASQEKPMEVDGPAEDIKQRWRRQQIAIQQKFAAPEKSSFWGALTRNRCCLPRTTRGQLRC
jgi:hypothetical protein